MAHSRAETSALVVGAYLAGLAAKRRVAVLGNSAHGVAELLAEAAGRRAHAFDPDNQRAAAALAATRSGRSAVTHAPLDTLEDHSGSFDLVVVDLDLTGDDVWPAVEQALSARGVVVAYCRRAVAAAEERYYQLYDLVSERFDEVRMYGQAPFVGFAMADFGAGNDTAVTIDTSLVEETEEPSHFVAIGSHQPLRELDEYAVVQVPSARWSGRSDDAEEPADTVRGAEAEVAKLQAELRDLRRVNDKRQQAQSELTARNASMEQELAGSRRRGDRLAAELDELRSQLRKQAASAESERDGELQRKLQAAERRVAAAEERARLAEERAASVAEKLQDAEAARAEAIGHARQLREGVRDAERIRADLNAEVKRLEEALERQADEQQQELDLLLDRIADLEGSDAPEEDTDPGIAGPVPTAASQRAGEPPTNAGEAEVAPPSQVRSLSFQLDELRKALDAARRERDAAQQEATRVAALEGQLAEAKRSAAQLRSQLEGAHDDEAIAADVTRLEAQLRERAGKLDELTRALRESERIGRELVDRLQLPPERKNGEAAGGEGMQALVQRCSRYEADLEAARWKIQALEAKLVEVPDDGDGDVAALEAALKAAHDEIAQLRRER